MPFLSNVQNWKLDSPTGGGEAWPWTEENDLPNSEFCRSVCNVGRQHYDSGLSVCTTGRWGFLSGSGSVFHWQRRQTWPWKSKMAAETRNAYISSGVRHTGPTTVGLHYRWLAHRPTRETSTSMSTFTDTTNYSNLRPTSADVDQHRKCKLAAANRKSRFVGLKLAHKPKVLLLLVMHYVSGKYEIITYTPIRLRTYNYFRLWTPLHSSVGRSPTASAMSY